MDMDVSPQILLPGMQHQSESGLAAKMARAGSKLGERARRRLEQHVVDQARMPGDQTMQNMRQREP